MARPLELRFYDTAEALGGRLDLVADFGDRTVRLPVSDTATAA